MPLPPLNIPETVQIQFIPTGGHYVLRRIDAEGNEQSVNLTPDDILKIYQALPQYARLVMQASAAPIAHVRGLESEVWVGVRGVQAVLDAHHTVVLSRIKDEFGIESRFLFDPQLARQTGELLLKRAGEIQTAASGRTRQ
jgi:hypothetical protein